MNNDNSTLREYWQLIRKRRTVALTVFVGVIAIVVLGTFMMTPVYEGSVKIMIERVGSDSLKDDRRSPTRDDQFATTQYQLIQSHAVSKRVVNLLSLEDSYEEMNQPVSLNLLARSGKKIKEWFSSAFTSLFSEEKDVDISKDGKTIEKADRIADKLKKNVQVRPIEGSQIVAINFNSPNPEFAALVANTYVKAYLEETLEMKMDATRRNLEWMTQKADAERLKQQAEEGRLQEYIKNNNLVTLENRVAILPEKMSQLGRDLVTAETKTKEYKLLYDKVQNVSDNLDAAETVLSISEGGSLDVLRSLILKAEQNIMELSSKYGEKHPVMIKARGDLSVLKKKRQQEIHRIIEKVKEQYDQARSNESSIRAQLEKTKAEALDLNEKYVEYSSLKGEIETNRQLYDALLTKLKDQSLTGETRPVNIWVVENANTPIKPAKPIIALNLSLGLFLGIVFSLGCVFLFDQYDNKIKSVEGVQDALKVPVLGSVSFNKKANDINESIVNDPRSEYAENFNSLRTTLLLSSADTPPKKILVTSSVAGEGKTTVSVNLALSMAMAGSSVALIDADMRKSSIYKIFNLENDLGLSNYLTESSKTKSKRKSIGPLSIYLQKSTHKNLSIIPSGPVPPNPYGLLNSNRMEGLIAELEEEFDFIICDSPPVLSVADSRLLSRMFDGLILITRSGLTSFSMAKETINLLQNVNAHIFGILINGVQEIDQADYYGAYRSYFDETNKVQKVAAGPHLKKDTTNDDPTEREL